MNLVTTSEAAELLGVSPSTIRSWGSKGILRRHHIGGATRWELKQLRARQKAMEARKRSCAERALAKSLPTRRA